MVSNQLLQSLILEHLYGARFQLRTVATAFWGIKLYLKTEQNKTKPTKKKKTKPKQNKKPKPRQNPTKTSLNWKLSFGFLSGHLEN